MGMAASQARLLSLTARLNDVEFEAQSIEYAKLALADQEDAVYQKYLAALDATQITGSIMKGAEKATVPATFQNLCGGYENMLLPEAGSIGFALVNQKTGRLYVTQEMYDAYKDFQGDDSDEFSLKMLGYSQDEIQAYLKHRDNNGTFYPVANVTEGSATTNIAAVNYSSDAFSSTQKYYVKDNESGGYKECTNLSTNYLKTDENGNKVFDTEKISSQPQLYTSIPEGDTRTPEAAIIDFYAMNNALKSSQGQYYKNTFEMIKLKGSCMVLEKEYQNNANWLTQMVENGEVGIYTFKKDTTSDSGYKLEQTSTAASSAISDTAITSFDQTELKRAEAEYNKDLKAINRKDTQFDLALEDLETERTAITTEMDAVKTVIKDNVQRTFGVFS